MIKLFVIACLLTLCLSIPTNFFHLEGQQLPPASAEESQAWSELQLNCTQTCLAKVKEGVNRKEICKQGVDNETCQAALEAAAVFGIVQCSGFCSQLILAATKDFEKCATDKCGGKRDEICGNTTCVSAIKDSIAENSKKLEPKYKEKVDLKSTTLEEIGDQQKQVWGQITAKCVVQSSAKTTLAIELLQPCQIFDIDCEMRKGIQTMAALEMIEQQCEESTERAVELFEMCSKIRCQGKRDQECADKCEDVIDFYYYEEEKAAIEEAEAECEAQCEGEEGDDEDGEDVQDAEQQEGEEE